MTFAGFARSAIGLLAKLPSFDERPYAQRRDLLASGGTALMQAVAQAVDAGLSVHARSSVSPLHRDLRFAESGGPRYKDHLLLTAWHGLDKKAAPTLWVRIDAECVGFASGISFTSEVRMRWREAVDGRRGEVLADHIAGLKKRHRRHEIEVAGERVKRVPKPWEDDHPRADLVRLTGFQVRFREPLPKVIDKPGFTSWCETRLRDLPPVHRWLVSEIGTKEGTP